METVLEEPVDIADLAQAAVRDLGGDAAMIELDAAEATGAPLGMGLPRKVRASFRCALREVLGNLWEPHPLGRAEDEPIRYVRLQAEVSIADRAELRVRFVHGYRSREIVLPLAGAEPLAEPSARSILPFSGRFPNTAI